MFLINVENCQRNNVTTVKLTTVAITKKLKKDYKNAENNTTHHAAKVTSVVPLEN